MTKEFDTKWFKLENYEKCKQLDLYSWSQLFHQRAFVKLVLLSTDDKKSIEANGAGDALGFDQEWEDEKNIHSGDWERWHTTALHYLNKMKTRPISSYKDPSGDKDSKYNPSVTSITVYEMWNLATQWLLNREWATCEYLNNFMEISSKKAKSIEKPYDFACWNKGVIENIGVAHISVDLLVPDEQILKDFMKLIKDVRKELHCYSRKKNFTQTDMLKWHDIRLLPFIDLTIISLIEGKKIKQQYF